MNTAAKIKALRTEMKNAGVAAMIIPSADPHQSEYIAPCWRDREWISGFKGSAGTVVVTQEKAGLWTDSRYFLQAELEIKGSGIELFKMGMPQTPDHLSWLKKELKAGDSVAINGTVFAVFAYRDAEESLKDKNIKLIPDLDLISAIWTDRPAVPAEFVYEHAKKFHGTTVKEKLSAIRAKMAYKEADYHLVTALDDIAWTLNLRGADVKNNPVAISFLVIGQEEVMLFIDKNKVDAELIKNLKKNGVAIFAYGDIYNKLKKLSADKIMLVTPKRTSIQLYNSLPAKMKKIEGDSIPTILKALKNPKEIAGWKKAMIEDGVAMCKFWFWLENNVGKIPMTEITVAEKLTELRKQGEDYVMDSFDAIAGYLENGAFNHYKADPKTAKSIQADGMFLLDSGGNYLNGTTDITRTFTLGNTTDQEMIDYSLVLKGHINLGNCVFPAGTKGHQLDSFARKALWEAGFNYGHGTGHGIGYFLSVHEGPQNIGQAGSTVALEVGMTLSNEPGLYRDGKYGIRIENLITVIPAEETEFGQFLKFETLTLCPYDRNLIIPKLLSREERQWLNSYHSKVYRLISPRLRTEEKEWLLQKTARI